MRTKRGKDEVALWRAQAIRPIFAAIERQARYKATLATRYGVSRQTLRHYERGEVRVKAGFIDWMIQELALDANTISPEARALIERKSQEKGA